MLFQLAKTCSENCASVQINHGKTPTVPSRQEIVNTINQLGYAHVPSEFYLPNESQCLSPLLKKVQETYQAVPPDVSSIGNRFRSLIQYAFRPDQNDFIEIERSHEYYQTADTNHIDGGKIEIIHAFTQFPRDY
uniref:Uncharacterized protein n=1 Tax=Acrobeloides nanus TaxID=290746 RepID=A0A914DVA3_9BILA